MSVCLSVSLTNTKTNRPPIQKHILKYPHKQPIFHRGEPMTNQKNIFCRFNFFSTNSLLLLHAPTIGRGGPESATMRRGESQHDSFFEFSTKCLHITICRRPARRVERSVNINLEGKHVCQVPNLNFEKVQRRTGFREIFTLTMCSNCPRYPHPTGKQRGRCG